MISADVVRPEHLPDTRIAVEHQARVYAALWRTDWGTFAHQGDGPRGWVQSVRILEGNLAVIPCKEGAVVLRVLDDHTELVVKMPFEGRLRASCRAGGEVLAVNHEGKVYRAALPENL